MYLYLYLYLQICRLHDWVCQSRRISRNKRLLFAFLPTFEIASVFVFANMPIAKLPLPTKLECCSQLQAVSFVLTFVFVFVFANMLIPILPNRQCLCGPSWRGARNYKPCICIFIYICICIGIGISTYICICIGIGICTCEQGGLLAITGQVFAFSLTFVFVFV